MKKIFTLVMMALMAVGVNAQTTLTLGGQGAAGDWSWGWNQTLGASIGLSFTSQWGEFYLAKEGLTEGATYKLVVAEPNAKVTLRLNNITADDTKYIAIDQTEITGTIPANTDYIGLQGTEAGEAINVVSFTINDVQTQYAVYWGTAFLGGTFTATAEYAEIMLNGAENKAGQDIIINAASAIPGGLMLKVKYADGEEGYPAVPSGVTTAKIYIEKPFNQISLQASSDAVNSTLDITSVTASYGVWTVLGSSALFGAGWAVDATDNDMATEDGVTYTLTKENLTLEANTNYEYKVLKDHDSNWAVNYGANGALGGSNLSLTVQETAIYKVVFTFDSQTHIISATAEKTGDVAGPITHTYSVIGTLVGSWDVDTDMTMTDDGIYTATFTDVAAGDYKFKVREDHDWSVSYPGSDYQLKVETAGSTVEVTFDPVSHNVVAIVTVPTGIQTVKAQQNNAVRFNLAGQKVGAGFKGLVIMNGKKMMVK